MLTANVLPEFGRPCIGYNSAWIDLDFNPSGISECFLQESDEDYWIISKWDNDQDYWQSINSIDIFGDTETLPPPTHWAYKEDIKNAIINN